MLASILNWNPNYFDVRYCKEENFNGKDSINRSETKLKYQNKTTYAFKNLKANGTWV